MPKKFVRQESRRHSKLGKKRKKLQIWRKPKGRDSKMRLKKIGHLSSPMVGYKSPRKTSGKIQNLKPVLVYNVKDLNALSKNSIAILARVGAKKKFEIIKHAEEKKIKILNVKEAAK